MEAAHRMSDNDTCADLNCFPDELDEVELHSALQNVSGPLNPSTPPPPHVVVPAEQELNIHPQIDQNLSGGYGGCTPLGAAPHSVEPPSPPYSTAGTYSQGQQCYIHPQINQSLSGGYGGCTPLGAAPLNVGQAAPILYQGPQNAMRPGPLYGQAGAYSQGQNLPYVPSAAATTYAAAPPQPYNNVPVIQLHADQNQSLRPLGVLNGELVYGFPVNFPTTSTSTAPPQPPPTSNFTSKKRKHEDSHDGRPYVKKPPNAFLLFMKEQRPKYLALMKITGTAAVNKILGDKWKSLSKEEQAKYFQEANRERRLHAQQHPDWSSDRNYGQKRKRERSKASKKTEASVSASGEVTQQAKKMCMTPGYTGVIEAHHAQSNVMEPSTSTTGVTVTHHAQSNVMEPSASLESNVMAGDKDLSTVGMLELLEISPPPSQQTQSPISEAVESQTTEPDPFAWLEDAMAVSFLDMLESSPPTPQTQPPISLNESDMCHLPPVASASMDSNHLARVGDPRMVELLGLLYG